MSDVRNVFRKVTDTRAAYGACMKAAVDDPKERARLPALRREMEEAKAELAVEQELSAERARRNAASAAAEDRARRREALGHVETHVAEREDIAVRMDDLIVELGALWRRLIAADEAVKRSLVESGDFRTRRGLADAGMATIGLIQELGIVLHRQMPEVMQRLGAAGFTDYGRPLAQTVAFHNARARALVVEAVAALEEPAESEPPAAA